MGRSMQAFYAPERSTFATSPSPFPAADTTDSQQPKDAAATGSEGDAAALAAIVAWQSGEAEYIMALRNDDEETRPRKYCEAPFDPDEDRDDAVYEAFLVRDGMTLVAPPRVSQSPPTPLDAEDMQFEEEEEEDNALHPSDQRNGGSGGEMPMTPSSGVFYPQTLPLALPGPQDRSRRGSSPLPSSTTSAAPSASNDSPLPTRPPSSFSLLQPSQLPRRPSVNGTSRPPSAPRLAHRPMPHGTTPALLPVAQEEFTASAETTPVHTEEQALEELRPAVE